MWGTGFFSHCSSLFPIEAISICSMAKLCKRMAPLWNPESKVSFVCQRAVHETFQEKKKNLKFHRENKKPHFPFAIVGNNILKGMREIIYFFASSFKSPCRSPQHLSSRSETFRQSMIHSKQEFHGTRCVIILGKLLCDCRLKQPGQ